MTRVVRRRRVIFAAFLLAASLGPRDSLAQRVADVRTASIAGVVFDSLRTSAPLAGASVMVVELNRYATADERGRFHFDSLTPGSYRLAFLHPMLDSLDLTASETTVDAVAGTATVVRLATPSPVALYARVCPAPREPRTGFVMGRVRDVDDNAPVGGAAVSSSWTELVLTNGKMTRETVGHRATTSAVGGFIFCGVPTDAPFSLRASASGSGVGPIEVSLGSSLVKSVNLALSRGAVATGRRATMRGTVRRADGSAVAGAVVTSDGASAPVRTDAAGAFTLGDILPGTRVVEVRALGMTPSGIVIDLRSGAVVDTTFTLSKPAQPLAPVAVGGRSDEIDRGEFGRRRRETAGYFATQAEIRKYTPGDLGDVFQRVPALRVQPGPPRAGAGTKQVTMMSGAGGNPFCVPTFFVDGVEYAGGGQGSFADVMDAVKPEMVKAIEVYRAGPSMPPRFDRASRTGCGSIVIWTR